MSPEEFYKRMKQLDIDYNEDTECKHIMMDELLCEALTKIGYGDGIRVFKEAHKWYA